MGTARVVRPGEERRDKAEKQDPDQRDALLGLGHESPFFEFAKSLTSARADLQKNS